MTQITRAMILAAGLGSRLGEVTKYTPKPLIDIGGTSPLIRTLQLMEQAGIEEVAINLHRFAEVVRATVNKFKTSMEITFFHEDELLETGGAVKNARSFLNDEPFLLINGDVIWLEDYYPLLQPLLNSFDPIQTDSLLALIPVHATTEFRNATGDFCLDNNNITVPDDKTKAPYVFAGIQVLHPRLIEDADETKFSLYPYFLKAIEKGRLKGVVYNGAWVDIGTPDGLNAARNLLSEEIKQAV